VIGAPSRWRSENVTADAQRDRSMAAYSLGMRAREQASLRGGGELFFAGVEQPTLVYYAGRRVRFVETSELKHVELIGAEAVPRHLKYLDLVLLDSRGRATAVGNLESEWNRLFNGYEPQQELTEADDFEGSEVVD